MGILGVVLCLGAGGRATGEPIWDPFGVEAYHRQVRDAIAHGVPGFAQGRVGGVTVSLENGDPTYDYFLFQDMTDIVEIVIVDIARGKGMASAGAISRSLVESLIESCRHYPGDWPEKQGEAKLLENFYLKGPGRALLR